MTTPNSDDFFGDMGLVSPPPAARPRTTLARPPAPKGTTGATTGTIPLKKAPAGTRPTTATAGRTAAGRRPTTAGRTGRPTTTAIGGAGRSPTGQVRPGGSAPAPGAPAPGAPAPGAPAPGAAAPGRTSPSAARGGRGGTTAGKRPTTARGTRPVSATTTATRPVSTTTTATRPASTMTPATRPASTTTAGITGGGVGFYGGGTASTHLTSSTTGVPAATSNNPYAAGGTAPAASTDWFAHPPAAAAQPQQQQQVNAYNPSQWQQPQIQQQEQQQQQQPSVNQWQNPQQTPQQAQQQQMQSLVNTGANFFLNQVINPATAGAPTPDASASATGYGYGYDIENEPPLLEELGINIDHILTKTKAVILPFERFSGNLIHMDPSMIVEDADLAGPLVFMLALGGELLMTGKLHFGYIYGFGMFGVCTMTLILNLMTPKDAISVWTVASILGYALLPVNILAAVKIIVVNIIRLETFGRILALLAVLWSTVASTRLLEVGCGMRHQRYLIGYPIALLYSAFVLMTIF